MTKIKKRNQRKKMINLNKLIMIPLPFKRQKPPKMKMTNPLILMISI